MRALDDTWVFEETSEPETTADLLLLEHHVRGEPHDDELGLRLLLERPEALSPRWRLADEIGVVGLRPPPKRHRGRPRRNERTHASAP